MAFRAANSPWTTPFAPRRELGYDTAGRPRGDVASGGPPDMLRGTLNAAVDRDVALLFLERTWHHGMSDMPSNVFRSISSSYVSG